MRVKPYAKIRDKIQDGDVFAVKNRGMFSIMIRLLTAESANHVAVLLWLENGLWVSEMRLSGYRLVRASQWVKENKGRTVFWVEAPECVRGNCVVKKIVLETKTKNPDYSKWTLVKVWWSQLMNRMHHGAMVCSTHAQHVWRQCGFAGFTRLADPGDFLEQGVSSTPVKI